MYTQKDFSLAKNGKHNFYSVLWFYCFPFPPLLCIVLSSALPIISPYILFLYTSTYVPLSLFLLKKNRKNTGFKSKHGELDISYNLSMAIYVTYSAICILMAFFILFRELFQL